VRYSEEKSAKSALITPYIPTSKHISIFLKGAVVYIKIRADIDKAATLQLQHKNVVPPPTF
jgi:hypothetical protein